MLNDLRLALRSFRNHPGFALAAVGTFAVGIGATTAIFSTVNAALLRPLPYPRSQDIRFIARSPGLWGRGLRLTLSFSTTALAFSLGAGGRIEVDPRAGLQVGTTLRLTDADGHAMLAVCEGLTRVRDLTQARERLALDLSLPPPYPPAFVEVVEAVLDIDDGQGRRERFEHLALAAGRRSADGHALVAPGTPESRVHRQPVRLQPVARGRDRRPRQLGPRGRFG